MNNIKIVTFPDLIFSDCLNILCICPSDIVLKEFQTKLESFEGDCNIYLFEETNYDPERIDYLLSIFKMSNVAIMDLDNLPPFMKDLASYFIAKPKTFWLTNGDGEVYNHISRNRVYNLDFLSNIGGYFETEQ